MRSHTETVVETVFPLVRICPYKYGFFFLKSVFVRIFIQIFGLCMDFFLKRDHFHRFYSLILLFRKLCECDAICCELCDGKYQKNLVSILLILLLQTIDSIDTFFLFFYVRLRFKMMDNLFFVEKI